jgi:hypothetical protein
VADSIVLIGTGLVVSMGSHFHQLTVTRSGSANDMCPGSGHGRRRLAAAVHLRARAEQLQAYPDQHRVCQRFAVETGCGWFGWLRVHDDAVGCGIRVSNVRIVALSSLSLLLYQPHASSLLGTLRAMHSPKQQPHRYQAPSAEEAAARSLRQHCPVPRCVTVMGTLSVRARPF